MLGNADGIAQLTNNPEILQDVIQCMGAESIGVSKEVWWVISVIGPIDLHIPVLFLNIFTFYRWEF